MEMMHLQALNCGGDIPIDSADDIEELKEIKDVDYNKEDQKNENETWRHVERPRGKFYRKFWLPENAKIDEVKASMENGVLTVTIPKQEIKKSEANTIEIN
ncbi:hypothetical protein H5410_044220 [Solanum commersonii]|uniref:SHSP domain-containing protein n=1 Tax=Solanum commersonii TaxID=4109 RepID=A0A9J5X7F5_SOLCO|nr:hypothetical protein H5410_044220 [Solanum commersonii]